MIGIGLALAALSAASGAADDLYRHDGWPALASDRRAHRPGDILTVLVLENSSASNTVRTGTSRESRVEGQIGVGGIDESGGVGLRGRFAGDGQSARTGRIVAQLSVTVTEVLPNGDLAIAGTQRLNIDGERTDIRLSGRVRTADVTSANTVLSARIADAAIDYEGSGFVTRGARPGLVQRVLGFLGLM